MMIVDNNNLITEQLDEFVTNFCHDIRTPMNGIVGMSEVALENEENEEKRANLMYINYCAKTLMDNISEILEQTKIYAQEKGYRKREYHIDSLIRDMSLMARMNLQSKDVRFEVELAGDIPNNAVGDVIYIKRILINIIGNAIKYTNQGKIVLKVWVEKENVNKLCFSVSDTGKGIAENDRERIFEKYETAVQGDVEYGNGIGLSTVRRLVKRMDGEVNVCSSLGKGSTFIIKLPHEFNGSELCLEENILIKNIEKEYEHMRNKTTTIYPEAKVLVVDDMVMNHHVMEMMLQKYGISADKASSAQEAIQFVGDKVYDLIFMDHMMPGQNGVEAMKLVRQLDNGRSVPIVALTADAMRGRDKYFEEMGFQDYLAKPVSQYHLKRIIVRYMPFEKTVHGENKLKEEERNIKEQWLWNIRELDVEKGISTTGGKMTDYMKILRTYSMEIFRIRNEETLIKRDSEFRDIAVIIHGIKSTTRTIGADDIADEAQTIEDYLKNCGKSVDPDDSIWMKIQRWSKRIVTLAVKINQIVGDVNDIDNIVGVGDTLVEGRAVKKDIENAELKGKFEKLYEAIKCYDSIEAENIISEIRTIIPEGEKNIVEEISRELEMYEYEKCLEIIKVTI